MYREKKLYIPTGADQTATDALLVNTRDDPIWGRSGTPLTDKATD